MLHRTRALTAVLMMVVAMTAGAKPPPPQREAEVHAFTATDGGVASLPVKLTARLAANPSGVPSVGVLATSPLGTGPQALATLWQAALLSTSATHSNLLESEFTLRVGAPIDAASAGLLTASTFTALLRKKRVLPNTTLVGGTTPDGSASPTDDVLPRLRAAAAAGIKRFGIPVGSRQHVSATGPSQDLVVEGQRLGVEVKELSGLDDAYAFLTGEVLPRPAPATEADMELWPAELAGISQLTAQTRKDLDGERPVLDEALQNVKANAMGVWKTTLDRSIQQAMDFERSGDPVRAMVVWLASLLTVRVAMVDAKLAAALEAHEPAAVLEILESEQRALPAARAELRKQVEERFPNTTRANDMYALDVLESVVTQGTSLQAERDAKALSALDPNDPNFGKQARQVARRLVDARESILIGQKFVALYAALPRLKKSDPPVSATTLAGSYATANAAAREALRAELTPTLEKDATYSDLLGYAELLTGETDPRARLILAARESVYSAYLLNTYGALGAQVDDHGDLTIRNTRALSSQLDQAKQRTLQACGRAKREGGLIPFAARLRYLNARTAREGTHRQKSESLADLWFAQWWCELAVQRGR